MELKKLSLVNFRIYSKREFEFDLKTTVLVGANAVGKTNVLEAIYLLATGESFRAEKIEEMVNWQAEVAHIEGVIVPEVKAAYTSGMEQTKLQVTLTRGEVQGKGAPKRLYKMNGVGKRKLDYVGKLLAVIFRPEDLELIGGNPGKRRRFLDGVLGQIDREYRRSLASYEKGLRRRNKVLDLIREGETDRRALAFWDQLLVKEGNILTERRRELVEFFNTQVIFTLSPTMVYDPSVISVQRLAQYEREEVAAGYTLVGPHKDDFSIVSGESFGYAQDSPRELSKYGSRGEQRMAVVWLKLAELNYLTEKLEERPVLLLDDIFSELDDEHDKLVMSLLGKQQTIITTTEVNGRFERMSDLAIKRISE